jgi:transcription termination factor NusB
LESVKKEMKKKKEKDIQELLEAKENAHSYCRHHLQGVVKNIQKLRKQLKKPRNIYSVEIELIRNQILLEEVVKHLKKK